MSSSTIGWDGSDEHLLLEFHFPSCVIQPAHFHCHTCGCCYFLVQSLPINISHNFRMKTPGLEHPGALNWHWHSGVPLIPKYWVAHNCPKPAKRVEAWHSTSASIAIFTVSLQLTHCCSNSRWWWPSITTFPHAVLEGPSSSGARHTCVCCELLGQLSQQVDHHSPEKNSHHITQRASNHCLNCPLQYATSRSPRTSWMTDSNGSMSTRMCKLTQTLGRPFQMHDYQVQHCLHRLKL